MNMKLSINENKYEFNSNKFDTIFQEQKEYVINLIREGQKSDELEKYIMQIISLMSISNDMFGIAVDNLGEDKIIEIIKAERIEIK